MGKIPDAKLEFLHGDSWERMLRQGVQLLERLAQDDRIEINRPAQNLEIKLVRALLNGNDFVAYIDAIGKLDGSRSLLEWKTTASRYPEEPTGLLALDPQLICYSWMSGISEIALVAFVRKRFSEIQYLKTTISEEQRQEFGQMVEAAVSHTSALFSPKMRRPSDASTFASRARRRELLHILQVCFPHSNNPNGA
jgi:hypothetical protein